MKKLVILFIFSLTILPTAFSQSRSPAVEPQRGISIDREPEYNGHPGFQFKQGQPVSLTDTQPTGTRVYAVLFMMALASMPFLMHVIFKGNVVPLNANEEQGTSEVTTEDPSVASLKDFRETKSTDEVSSDESTDEDIKKAS